MNFRLYSGHGFNLCRLYKILYNVVLCYRVIFQVIRDTSDDIWKSLNSRAYISMTSCQKGPTRHAYAWPIWPFFDVIKWKHFPRNWPFVRIIHQSPANSPHKGQWRGALMFSFICVWTNDCVNNREAGDLRRYRAHYDVIVMILGGQGGD